MRKSKSTDQWLEEEFDVHESPRFIKGKEEIERFVEAIRICTYGSLGRRYSEYADLLDLILESSHRIKWNKDGAAPRKIEFHIEEKRNLPELGFNSQTPEAREAMYARRKAA